MRKSGYQKFLGLFLLVLLYVVTYRTDLFKVEPVNLYSESNVLQTNSLDTSRIWTRGPMGNAVENATKHFQKHGHEFGFKTEQEYVAAAVKFTTEPLPTAVLKNIQRDGDVAFYNPKTAEYGVRSKNGYIRTYFKLNPRIHGYKTNTDYFNAQAKIGSTPPANDNRQR